MALKMTQTLMIDLLKVNEGRKANGLPPLTWEEYAALVEARQLPEILPTKPADIAARAADVAAGKKPFDPRAADFLDYALGSTRPANSIDAVLYQKNLEQARGMVGVMTLDAKAELFKTLGLTATGSPQEQDERAIEMLAVITASMGYDIAALAAEVRRQLPTGAGVDVFRKIQNEIGRTLEHVGAEMKRWMKAPAIGYVLGPLGVKFLGESLYQVGAMTRGGSVRDFDTRAEMAALGESLNGVGRLHAMAAPWLPAPWNAVAGAIAAVTLAGSKAISGHIASREAAEQAAAEQAALTSQGAVVEPTDEQIVWAYQVLESSQGRAPGWTITDADYRRALEIAQSPRVQAAAVQGAGCGVCALAV